MAVSVRGAELHFSKRGRGPLCFVLSGIGTKPYERQIPSRLAEHLTLVCVDLRGSGRSTGDASDLSFDVLAEDLESVRTHLDAERVIVLGHSVIGILAIEYARRCPESVSHIVVAGTPPAFDLMALQASSREFFEADASSERKQRLASNMAQLGSTASPAQLMLAQTPMRFYDPTADAASLFADAELQPGFLPHVLGTLARGWDIQAGAPLMTPLLVAHGRYDYTVPYTLWDGVLPKLPKATRQLFQKSGHQPFYEEPEAFTTALLGWLER
jgi:proline iminopeptidase